MPNRGYAARVTALRFRSRFRSIPNTINKTLVRLAQILGAAVEYDLIESNPASGKSRREKLSGPASAPSTGQLNGPI